MSRNISDDCVNCEFRNSGLGRCMFQCEVTDKVLLEIEKERNLKGLGNAAENGYHLK